MSKSDPKPAAQTDPLMVAQKTEAAAKRALAEAAERQAAAPDPKRPTELGGRDGLDPARYGDWEKKGIAIDF